jgi:hypothetical protein
MYLCSNKLLPRVFEYFLNHWISLLTRINFGRYLILF